MKSHRRGFLLRDGQPSGFGAANLGWVSVKPEFGRDDIDAALVRSLVADQFPQWTTLPVTPVEPGGWDHRTFRLGENMLVRLPSAPGYVPQVAKEQTWLPRLASRLPLPIPEVLGAGRPTKRYPAPWSIYDWKPGEPAATAWIDDRVSFARDLGTFLAALRGGDASDGPLAGAHSAYRGAPLEHYDDETRDVLQRLRGRERDLAASIWDDALTAPFTGAPVWFHGDVTAPNLLVINGRLSAVIDFGCSGIGDPSCDTTIAWTFFDGASRRAFADTIALDEATWARGRGWALWKALITLASTTPGHADHARRVLDALFTDRDHD